MCACMMVALGSRLVCVCGRDVAVGVLAPSSSASSGQQDVGVICTDDETVCLPPFEQAVLQATPQAPTRRPPFRDLHFDHTGEDVYQ